MRIVLLALLAGSMFVQARAERPVLKPTDFEPLTSLPWKKEGVTLEGVLAAIFREPDPAIRYPVLAAYWQTLPVEELGGAFDRCIQLEGTNTPDQLVATLLRLWASRDPVACWKRTRQLFGLVGIEDGWLNYDGWERRAPITVKDRAAIEAAGFWLYPTSLKSFPLGVEASPLPREERVKLMKTFADQWFTAFASWPGFENWAGRN